MCLIGSAKPSKSGVEGYVAPTAPTSLSIALGITLPKYDWTLTEGIMHELRA